MLLIWFISDSAAFFSIKCFTFHYVTSLSLFRSNFMLWRRCVGDVLESELTGIGPSYPAGIKALTSPRLWWKKAKENWTKCNKIKWMFWLEIPGFVLKNTSGECRTVSINISCSFCSFPSKHSDIFSCFHAYKCWNSSLNCDLWLTCLFTCNSTIISHLQIGKSKTSEQVL